MKSDSLNVNVNRVGALLEFLIEALPEKTRTVLKQWLKYRAVSVNGRIQTQFDYALRPRDEIRIETASQSKPVAATVQFNLQIVYEDDTLIVVNKPAGLLSIATEKIQRETAIFAVNDYLNKKAQVRGRRPEYAKRVFIVHRLDRDVSGLMVLAKNEAAKLKLQEEWAGFKKEYWAVVEGCPSPSSGTLTSYLAENKSLKVFASNRPGAPGARQAITHYEVLKAGEDYSSLKIQLGTGRKHQIRVQLSEIGHPVAGDMLYGARTNPFNRIALHAWRLTLKHPVTGQDMIFTSELPRL